MEYHDGKEGLATSAQVVEDGFVGDPGLSPEKAGTLYDQKDMARVGKTQELRRNFRFISILGFTAVLMCTWEAVLITAIYGLINGGLAGLVWMYVVSVIGFGTAILSMAEMASMAPTSGGQYHWVSEFAPRGAQKFLSFVTGWLCVMGWQVNIGSGGYIVATQVQGLLILNDPNYVFERWHGTLLIIAVAVCSILFNTFLAKKLPLIEGLILILHVFGFFAVLIPLWIFAPRTPASVVFTQFSDGGNWGSIGLACLVGMTGPVYSLVGPDSAVHMAEEIKDSSRVLPLSMMWTILLNGITGFIMVVTFCFCAGDITEILSTPTGFPFIQVFYNATQSYAGATIMTSIIITMALCSTISNVATASRQMFAFARDQGLPFSTFLSHVKPGWDIPLNAVAVTFVIVCLLALINIGSSVAFNAVVSLSLASLLSSYIISISCVRLKRWRGEPLPARRWSLGRYGAPLNTVAILYLLVAYVFAFFPLATPVVGSTMNWSILIYGSVIIFALSYYYLHGRHVYEGPVVLVKQEL